MFPLNHFFPLGRGEIHPLPYDTSPDGMVGIDPIPESYPDHLENTTDPTIMSSQPINIEPGMLDPQFSGYVYGNGIRPAMIPRTEDHISVSNAGPLLRSLQGTRSSTAGGMTLDLSDSALESYVNQSTGQSLPTGRISLSLDNSRLGDYDGHNLTSSPNTHQDSSSMTTHDLSPPGLESSGRGEMSLHLSVERGHESIVRLLLGCGADPNGRDDYGSTPLHLAAKQGDETVVQTLLDKGADVNARNANGWSAIHIASKYGQEKVLRLLIQRGADLNAKAKDDKIRGCTKT
jgi:hypothetical protein